METHNYANEKIDYYQKNLGSITCHRNLHLSS